MLRISGPTRDETAEPVSSETQRFGANGVREKIFCSVQLTTRRVGNHTAIDLYSGESADHLSLSRSLKTRGRRFQIDLTRHFEGVRDLRYSSWPDALVELLW